MHHRHIHLHAERARKIVADDELRDAAVEILAGGICDAVAVLLERAEVRELFAHADVPAGAVFDSEG